MLLTLGADATGLTALAAFLLVPRDPAAPLVAGVETTGSGADEPLPLPPLPVEAGGDLIPDPPSPAKIEIWSQTARISVDLIFSAKDSFS